MPLSYCPFLWFFCSSAIACSNSDNNSTCVGWQLISKKCSYRSRLRRKSIVSMTKQRNRENKEITSIFKLQVIIIWPYFGLKWTWLNNNNNNFIFFYLNASTLNNTDTVRPGGGEKTLRSSRLPPPKYMLSKTLNLNERAQRPWANQQKRKQRAEHCFNLNHTCTFQIISKSKK